MKKITVALIVFTVSLIGFAFIFTACQDTNPNAPPVIPEVPNDNGTDNNVVPKKLDVGFLANFSANTTDAAALGVERKTANLGRSARSARNVAENATKNYLVRLGMDDAGLSDVTFIRSTEAEDGQNGTLTQEEIPAQVNRLYVHGGFTFIQFISDDTTGISDVRPVNTGRPDENGYFEFDKRDYYSDDYHQSFIIENNNGYIYSLGDAVKIKSIHNGLLKLDGSERIYDYRINNNDELEIFPILLNTTIYVHDYFKDKHGNNYILNNVLSERVEATNTIYFRYFIDNLFTEPQYMVARNNGEVLFANASLFPSGVISFPFLHNDGHYYVYATELRLMGPNLSDRPITEDDYLEFNEEVFIRDKKFYIWQGGGGYTNQPEGSYATSLFVLDTDTVEFNYCLRFYNASTPRQLISFNQIDRRWYWENRSAHNLWEYNDKFILVFIEDKMYYYQFDINSLAPSSLLNTFGIDKIGASLSYNYIYNESDGLFLLLQNFNVAHIWGPWKVSTITGTNEYTVVLEVNEDGVRIPTLINLSEYKAEEPTTIVFQPINR